MNARVLDARVEGRRQCRNAESIPPNLRTPLTCEALQSEGAEKIQRNRQLSGHEGQTRAHSNNRQDRHPVIGPSSQGGGSVMRDVPRNTVSKYDVFLTPSLIFAS